jgi:hypothetical protein
MLLTGVPLDWHSARRSENAKVVLAIALMAIYLAFCPAV